MASEEFKQKLDNFFNKLKQFISDSVVLDNLTENYNHICDNFNQMTIISDEELEGFENEINSLSNEVQILTNDNSKLKKLNDELKDSIKNNNVKSKMDNEGLLEKIKILQQTLDMYSNKSNESDNIVFRLESQINDLKNDNINLATKYKILCDEVEINTKNIKKNFVLEKTIQDLTEENERLSIQIKKFQNSEDFKLKFIQLETNYKELKEKYNQLNNNINELKTENAKLSNENFNKFDIINSLQNDLKLKNHKLEEVKKENEKYLKTINLLENQIKEGEYNIKSKKAFYENQTKELKKELDKLVKNHETLKKDYELCKDNLKKYQEYIDYAKVSKEILSKKDFSILETMSRRVEELELLNNDLRNNMKVFVSDNENMNYKIKSMENILIYYMKDDINVLNNDLNHTNINQDEYDEINQIKDSREKLLEMIFSLKKENFILKKDIEIITVECNTLLRKSVYN